MGILDIIFPKRCLGCGRIGSYFCKSCVKKINFIESGICPMCGRSAFDGAIHPGCRTTYMIDGLTSFFQYDGTIQKAIKALKYRFVFDLASEFVSLIPSFNIPRTDILIPMPLHPSRFRERGYNQAEVLGKLIAQKICIPMHTGILKRVRKTTPQVEMKKRKERLENMKNVFSVQKEVPSRVILFDDVFTTGATMRSAAKVLKRNGATFVWGMTMAR